MLDISNLRCLKITVCIEQNDFALRRFTQAKNMPALIHNIGIGTLTWMALSG